MAAREILNAIFYVLKNGCAWRAMPGDLPKWQTVFVQRNRWTKQGVLSKATELVVGPRAPSVGIIDSTFIESAYGGAQRHSEPNRHLTGRCLGFLPTNEEAPASD